MKPLLHQHFLCRTIVQTDEVNPFQQSGRLSAVQCINFIILLVCVVTDSPYSSGCEGMIIRVILKSTESPVAVGDIE